MAAGCVVSGASCRTAISLRGYRGEETLRFERICQPWLKEAAKRWARARPVGRHRAADDERLPGQHPALQLLAGRAREAR